MSIAIKHLLEFGPFRIDPEQRLLLRDQEPIQLSPKAFELLLVLAQRSGQVVLKDELMTLLWPDTFVEESNLGQHIFQLRKVLGETAQDPSYILTVPGRGYRFVQGVKTIPAKVDDEIVLEKHSRSRLVIEEEESLPDRPPASSTKGRRILLVGLTVAALALLIGAAMILLTSLPSPKTVSVRQLTHSGRVEPYGKILSDGLRLYFTERRGGTEALAEVPMAGGEPTLISTSLASLTVDDIDSSKSRLLIGTQSASYDEPLWVVSTAGGSPQRVGDLMASAAAVWSPDGRNIIYGHDAQIFTTSEDGAESTKLLTAAGYVISLGSSPDGKLLRFTVRDSGSAGTHLWEAAADGSNPHRMSFGWKTAAPQWGEGESAGVWTPDGKYFIFRAAHDGLGGIWAIRENASWPHSSSPVLLYSSPDHIGPPQFSPDGKKIFFAIYHERRELVRYDSAQKIFVPYMAGMPARLLSFSKDYKWVAYRNETDGTLWRSRADGTEKLQLTFLPMTAYHSTWSTDGKRIVFGATLPGQQAKLYAVSADGGTPEPLTASNNTDGEPSYSPHGQFIIFERWTTNSEGTRHSSVCILDLNTRQVRELPGTKDYDGVHWSPDGKYAAASDEANKKLMIYDFERQRWSVLADGAAYGWGIRWSSDSRYVYYQHSDQGEEQPIFRVQVSDRKVEQITSARQILRADVLGYNMTGLTPDNSPVASLIQRDSDIYALEVELP